MYGFHGFLFYRLGNDLDPDFELLLERLLPEELLRELEELLRVELLLELEELGVLELRVLVWRVLELDLVLEEEPDRVLVLPPE